MIHYSSIKDAWGKKDMFKNNIPSGKFTNIYESATNCKTQTPNIQPTSPPETFTQKETIKYDAQTIAQTIAQNIEQPIEQPIEHFTQNNCAFMEHLQNCPFCMGKMKEHFADPISTSAPEEKPISTINLFGFEINITKDVLRILFVIILIVIFILLLRMVNVSFNKTNKKYLAMSNEELLRLAAQIKYISPMISQL